MSDSILRNISILFWRTERQATVGKRIAAGFCISVLITAALGVFAVTRFTIMEKAASKVGEAALPEVTSANDAFIGIQSNYICLTRHIDASTPQAKRAIEAEMEANKATITEAFERCESLFVDDEGRHLYADAVTARAPWLLSWSKVLTLSQQMKSSEARAVMESDVKPAYQSIFQCVRDLEEFATQQGQRSTQMAKATASSARTAIEIGIGAAIAISCIIAIFITVRINKALGRFAESLHHEAAQVAAASSQASSFAQSLAQGAAEQAAALEQTSSTLEEISSLTKKNADSARQASLLSGNTKTAAENGNTAMTRMNGAIHDIEKSAVETAKIVKTIDEIAFQTNLLALNAAVEAARAGEAGKGFAVVADEVRNLAMRSAEAAKNTAQLIERSIQSAKKGVSISQEVTTTLGEIQQAVESVYALVNEIAAAGYEQAKGISQVNSAVQQMDLVTQSNAAGAEQSAAASEELNSQAEQLKSVVAEMLAMIGTHHGTALLKAGLSDHRNEDGKLAQYDVAA